MEQTKIKTRTLFGPGILGYAVVVVMTVITIGVSWLLYEHTVNLLTNNLRERLISIVSTASVQFDAEELQQLRIKEDYKNPIWSDIVQRLIEIRMHNEDIVFAYILRKSESDPNKMVFVADSHSLYPFAKVDLDENGIVDDADALNWPNQEYEDVPPESFDGYIGPITNSDLYTDQWGVLISGYAPIKDKDGKTEAVMTVDVRADDFFTITRQTFYPFIIFIIALVAILIILAAALIKIWKKRVELIAEIDRQKDELLSIVSHQLATPVTSVKWYIEMLIDGDLGKITPEQQKHLESMSAITTNLSDLVSMILDVSRIQLGKVKLEKQKLDLDSFFKEILEVIEPKAKEKKIDFVKTLPKKLPVAMLDKRYTRMTIENLLSNAVKYTPEGGRVDLKVELRNERIYCEVKDTGCGIPKAEQSQIFGKLFRASNVRNSVDGNGFGLYVAKGAIEAQGGKIWFDSIEGKGTTFFVELPLH